MKLWFQARDYPNHFAQKEMNKEVRFNKQNSNTKQSKSKGVTFVVIYYPSLKSLQSLISKILNILYLDENVKEGFMPGSMLTFRSSKKLTSYLVRAKLYPLKRMTGLCRRKRCTVGLNFNETLTLTISVTHETCKINHKFDCNSNVLLIY